MDTVDFGAKIIFFAMLLGGFTCMVYTIGNAAIRYRPKRSDILHILHVVRWAVFGVVGSLLFFCFMFIMLWTVGMLATLIWSIFS